MAPKGAIFFYVFLKKGSRGTALEYTRTAYTCGIVRSISRSTDRLHLSHKAPGSLDCHNSRNTTFYKAYSCTSDFIQFIRPIAIDPEGLLTL